MNPISPRGVYDEAKRFGKAIITAYHTFHRLDTRIVRIFNTFGPRMQTKDGRVVSNFIVQALQKKPLSVYGDGSQTRSFCYADDLVRGIVALLLASKESSENDRTIHFPVNIGNPLELTVLEIAKMVLSLTGSTSSIEHHPLPTEDPKVRRPDIQRAKALLNWEPQVTLEEGLLKTITYFKSIL